MYHESLGAQAAIDRATQMMFEAYDRFDQTEHKLYQQVKPENLKDVESYIWACKDLIMCNLHWR